ncbi:hypothetical protein GKZ68_16295 [Hymenobacter sp. BRD128]|uniref:hypothetical protein n=1 Tax=Hymenobacter sp. BRD128 TaxID=2675878 RepID=UPI001564E32A|nr:hypothetical protein [Hymenobacter sp. BRD128]QKG58043.1 hypothetical protein GKZ68_16295 [Hymenobacter sp. BRD128]
MDSTASTPHTPPTPEIQLHVSDEQSTALLTDTLNLLGQGLPNADGATGLHELERWETVLAASDRPGLAKIKQEVSLLRRMLSSSDTQSHEVAEVLASLGAEASKVADESGSGYSDALHNLSKLLIKASNLLSR